MKPKVALATLTETRSDFRGHRQHLVAEEMSKLDWLEKTADLYRSDVIFSKEQVNSFIKKAVEFGAEALVIHIPIWTEPVLSVKFSDIISLPTLLLGNTRAETSSTVGILGAGGALDQIGVPHRRIFDHHIKENRAEIIAFLRAASAVKRLKGQTLGLFGNRGLGIMTATASTTQWHRLFGIDIEPVDQLEIIKEANKIKDEELAKHLNWLKNKINEIQFSDLFDEIGLERQVRSYLATIKIIKEREYDFVGVKCQPELSDGYTTQCIAHMLTNGTIDADGRKRPIVHSCEADADGALSMQILNLLSDGKPTALLDIRWFNEKKGVWTLANCGAIPASFSTNAGDGLSNVNIIPHVFGKAGGCALPMVVAPQKVTLARLCRKRDEYWMAIIKGETLKKGMEELKKTTAAFPQAFVSTSAGRDFLDTFGSNHIHMVSGDFSRELIEFCKQMKLSWKLWD